MFAPQPARHKGSARVVALAPLATALLGREYERVIMPGNKPAENGRRASLFQQPRFPILIFQGYPARFLYLELTRESRDGWRN